MTPIPGLCAVHAIITDDCRSGRGDEGALTEALRRLEVEGRRALEGWKGVAGVKIHLALTVERPPTEATK